MPNISIFHKEISGWFVLVSVIALGLGGYFGWKYHTKHTAKAAADKKAKADAAAAAAGGKILDKPKTERMSLYVPGAGQVIQDVSI